TNSITPNMATGESVIKDFHVWNMSQEAIFLYENYHLSIDGLVVRGHGGAGIYISDYMAYNLDVRNSDIQGMDVGFGATPESGGGTQTIENSYFHNQTDIAVPNLWSSGASADGLKPRKVIIRNVKFGATGMPWSTDPHYDIRMDYSDSPTRNLIQDDEVYVYDFNQV